MQNRLIAGLMIIISVSSLSAEERYDLSRFFNEAADFAKQPLRWDGNDYLNLGLIAGGTVLTAQADQSIRDSALRDRSYYNSGVIEGGRMWGEWYAAPAIASIFEVNGLATGNTKSKKICFELLQASIYSSAVTGILKAAFGRARPDINQGPGSYEPLRFNNDYYSLPSGHTTNAFAISTVLSRNADSDFLKVLAYVPAVFTAVSRVYQDYHWASDCVAGAAIGYFCAKWIVDKHEGKDKKSAVRISSIYPPCVTIQF